MFATAVRSSKASRRALTSKKANKDFYKGTGQATLPGGRRTGAPGVHVTSGSAKYRLLDAKVRVFVAPTVATLNTTPLRPYVEAAYELPDDARAHPLVNATGSQLYAQLTSSGAVAGRTTWRGSAPAHVPRSRRLARAPEEAEGLPAPAAVPIPEAQQATPLEVVREAVKA